MGVGGSIPFIELFLRTFPGASVLVTGVEDPDTRAHGANEGLHLAEFERVCLAETLLLANLATAAPVESLSWPFLDSPPDRSLPGVAATAD